MTDLNEAQALIVAMLKECGLSQVNICADSTYNRYAKAARNGGGGAFYRFESLEELHSEMKPTKPTPKIKQGSLL